MNVREAWFNVIMLVAAAGSFLALVYFGSRGNAWAAAAVPVVVSTIGMGVVRYTADFGQPHGAFIYSYRTQSWAFLFGDLIGLPLLFWGAAKGWQKFEDVHNSWYGSKWWLLAAVVLGILLSMAWYHGMNAPGYRKEGLETLLYSPTSRWHYHVVYKSLASAIIFLGVPVIGYQFKGFGMVVLAGLLVWGLFGAADATFHKLILTNLHPDKQDTWLADTDS